MLYSVLADAYRKIEATTKRLEITSLLVELLRNTPAEDIERVVYLTQGKLGPDYLGVELGIAEKLAIKVLAKATGRDEAELGSIYKKQGDLGTAAEKLLTGKTQLYPPAEALTVEEVYSSFDKIAHASGGGSTESKLRQLTALIGKASPLEAKYLTRMAVGNLRLGVADMTILDALAIARGGGKESRPMLERAYNLSSDLGDVAKTLATRGLGGIETFKASIGKPIRPMLAERLSDPREILEKMNGEGAAEYKYDGLRIQAHIDRKSVV